jgi:hypothetical protein
MASGGYGLEGARCASHPLVAASAVCTRCGDFICLDCVHTTPDGEVRCGACVDQRRAQAGVVAWERREELGVPQAFWETLRGSLLRPHEFFLQVAPDGPYKDAMLYLVICGFASLVGTLANQVAQVASGSLGADPGTAALRDLIGPYEDKIWLFGIGYILAMLVLGPLLIIVNSFIQAALVHVACLVVGANSGGYKGTWRALAYGQGIAVITGAVSLLIALVGAWHPILYTVASMLGGLVNMVAGLYLFVLMGFGIREVHQVTLGRAFGAVGVFFGGLLLLVCGCAALILGLGVMGAASF